MIGGRAFHRLRLSCIKESSRAWPVTFFEACYLKKLMLMFSKVIQSRLLFPVCVLAINVLPKRNKKIENHSLNGPKKNGKVPPI